MHLLHTSANGAFAEARPPGECVTDETLLRQVMLQNPSEGSVVLRKGVVFDGVKVFSATVFADRERLGEKVTAWIADNPQNQIGEVVVTQSSDASFHCITLTVFYKVGARAAA